MYGKTKTSSKNLPEHFLWSLDHGVATTAKKDHDSFLLNGEKTLISNGGIAD